MFESHVKVVMLSDAFNSTDVKLRETWDIVGHRGTSWDMFRRQLDKARFPNYVLTLPEPKPRDSRTKPRDSPTKAGALPQLHSHDSTTTLSRFHNQTPTIPQPKSQDSTTKLSGFHNQTLTIPQPNSHDSITTLSRFHNQNVTILQLTNMDSTRNALSVLQTVHGNASTDTSRQKQNDRQHVPSIIQSSASNPAS